ncbi:hypothetical protein FACS1894111_12970 [Clostridia bacterium]|nr:hypothetical protein FACS1894111_12970 [Clostridia bacterium]
MKVNENRQSRSARRSRKRKKILAGIAIAAVLLLFLALLGIQVLRAVGKSSLQKPSAGDAAPALTTDESLSAAEEEDGVIYHEGKKYRYNADMITLLFMGIDTRAGQESKDAFGKGGQADAIFLLALDNKHNKMQLIAIPRDTMTDIDVYDSFGTFFTTKKEQLALQYAYGDGKELSCKNTLETVSHLMYGLPIHGYLSIRMDAVKPLNDAVGGVKVTIPDDPAFCKAHGYKAGQEVTLRGKEALAFVQYRDTTTHETAPLRLAREKSYLMSFFTAVKTATKANLTLPLNLYQTIAPFMQTDVGIDEVSYLASIVTGMNLDTNNILTIQGEIKQGEKYEEFYPDEKSLYQLILDVFYEEVE